MSATNGSSEPNGGSSPKGRAELVSSLRKLSRSAPEQNGGGGGERCELCGTDLGENHRHLLHLTERRILCSCATCWAQRSGDPELRPTGSRIVWLDEFDLPEELWAKLQVPIGLAFFMRSSVADAVVAMYPSPAGATESELDLIAWQQLQELNPILAGIEPDAEALVVNRISDPPQFVVAPIDECYGLVGAIKMSWEGISGGPAIEREVPAFFADMRRRAGAGAS
ncbi:MAG: DUF5947 family protein [Actinomycetota bacterium]|nr:DUF5947 family protein [Actinomycetota bacterium]